MNTPSNSADARAVADEPSVPDRLPLEVRIIAWTYIASGVLAATDMLMSLAQRRLDVNVGLVAIFIGRGLLKRGDGWRAFAVVTAILCLIGSGLAIASVITFALLGKLNSMMGSASASPWATTFAIVASFAFFLWQYRVLTRPQIRDVFSPKRTGFECYDPPTRTSRFQFGLGTLIMLTVIASLVCWRFSDADLQYSRQRTHMETFATRRGANCCIEYAVREHRFLDRPPILDYVFFRKNSDGSPISVPVVRRTYRSGGRRSPASFEKPDGTTVTLTGDIQLFEIVDDQYRESRQRVTLRQLKACLDSDKQGFAIDALLDYVQQHPEIE